MPAAGLGEEERGLCLGRAAPEAHLLSTILRQFSIRSPDTATAKSSKAQGGDGRSTRPEYVTPAQLPFRQERVDRQDDFRAAHQVRAAGTA
jgi:hypothetical protein